MFDFFFKMYFSPFVKRGEQGANAAVAGASFTLSINEFPILLYLISFIVEAKELGAFSFLGILAGLLIFNFVLFNRVFIKNKRFEIIRIDNPGIYIVLCLLHFLFSAIAFPIFTVIVLSGVI